MTTHQKTMKLYMQGKKEEAYKNYLNDENSLPNISFNKFCESTDKMIGSWATYDETTNKWTNNYEA